MKKIEKKWCDVLPATLGWRVMFKNKSTQKTFVVPIVGWAWYQFDNEVHAQALVVDDSNIGDLSPVSWVESSLGEGWCFYGTLSPNETEPTSDD